MTGSATSESQWIEQRQLAQFDRLLDALHAWAADAPAWEPLQSAAALIARFEPRLRELQTSLERLLVVGLVGGTGTGKSTLLNALVGASVCEASDVQRPTTVRPAIVCAPGVDVGFLQLDDCQPAVQRLALPLLENILLVDCPDPDTQAASSTGTTGGNRDILRRVLPRCDVLIHVGTAQKYKTHAVSQELLAHAPGRQVIFVQTHAAEDDDIRDDWRRHLESLGFSVPQLFRVDSQAALEQRIAGAATPPEFQELLDFLQTELSDRARHRIRRANALDLVDWLLAQVQAECDRSLPRVVKLEEIIHAQRDALLARIKTHLAERLRGEKLRWRTRLLRQTSAQWGGGPFAMFLRTIGSFGALLQFLPLARFRGLTPVIVTGGVAAGRAILDRYQEAVGGNALTVEGLGVNEADIAQAQTIVEGYAQTAGLHLSARSPHNTRAVAGEALDRVGRRLHERIEAAVQSLVERRAAKKAGRWFHWLLELLFCALPGVLLYRLAESFFYEHLWLRHAPTLGLEYLVQALLWVVLWGLVLRGLLAARLQQGLKGDIARLVDGLAADQALEALFDDVEQAASAIQQHVAALANLRQAAAELRQEFGAVTDWKLGRLKT